jgi:Ca2+-binding EF-hand superfamily protein
MNILKSYDVDGNGYIDVEDVGIALRGLDGFTDVMIASLLSKCPENQYHQVLCSDVAALLLYPYQNA